MAKSSCVSCLLLPVEIMAASGSPWAVDGCGKPPANVARDCYVGKGIAEYGDSSACYGERVVVEGKHPGYCWMLMAGLLMLPSTTKRKGDLSISIYLIGCNNGSQGCQPWPGQQGLIVKSR